MKKLVTVLALVALFSASFVFANGAKESAVVTMNQGNITVEDLKNAHITLEFWHAQSQANGVAMDKVIALFNETNEYGITVNGTYQGGYNDCDKKIMAALAAGQAPNIAQAYNNNMMNYMPSGKLMDLTGYLKDGFGISAQDFATVLPSYLAENNAFPDGKVYATSLGKSTEVMFYNKTFFDLHGLKVPTTLDELAEVSKKITAITGRPAFGYDSLDNLGIYGPVNFGAKYADPQGHVYLFDADNLPKTKAFYEWWQQGIKGGYFRSAGEDKYCSGPFGTGQIIIYIGSSAGAAYITPDGFEVGIAQNPVGVNPAVIQQGGNCCGFTTGKPLVDLAASIFLEFMYDPEASALYSANTGYAPSNKAALDLKVYKDSIASGDIPSRAKAVSASYPDGTLAYDPVFTNSYGTRTRLSDIVEAIALDPNADIDALITEAKADLKLK
ncbi:MAG: extracellular solute-binding protein [Sphaerochaetaceae bacterium]|nr:extracellular solute-binding protein [Sphaerochaetaceae bacterium]